ncbi:MAG: SufD family Fe-S cluster assembly protein, partial [Candidatus Micrarchaeota archaeon]|nr:SufD family Fe-S cluster assembly protein [Candidatus Micrarchaeota archaeon]
QPLQAYFRINTENMGQFERTLIIADEGSQVHYVEGCSAPVYSTDSLHSAVVELVALPGARITYTTIQNWSNNVYNLVTKRARAEAEAHVEWIDGNIGSRLTMKYPSVYLMGPKASGEVLSVAYAGPGQVQDAGAKMVHCAPNTYSRIISKSISRAGGRASYRGLAKVVSRLPGGLLQTNIVGCALFASISGSSVATAASIGGVALPQLVQRNYDRRLSAGSLAAGGTLGILL